MAWCTGLSTFELTIIPISNDYAHTPGVLPYTGYIFPQFQLTVLPIPAFLYYLTTKFEQSNASRILFWDNN